MKRRIGKPWKCHAKPAAFGGRTCGFENEDGGELHGDLVCCAACGATKFASDDRARREQEGHRA